MILPWQVVQWRGGGEFTHTGGVQSLHASKVRPRELQRDYLNTCSDLPSAGSLATWLGQATCSSADLESGEAAALRIVSYTPRKRSVARSTAMNLGYGAPPCHSKQSLGKETQAEEIDQLMSDGGLVLGPTSFEGSEVGSAVLKVVCNRGIQNGFVRRDSQLGADT